MLKRDGHRCHRDECSIPHPLKLGSSYYRDRVSEVVVAMVGQYMHFRFFCFCFFLYFSYLFSPLSRLFSCCFFSSSSTKCNYRADALVNTYANNKHSGPLGLIVYIYISNLYNKKRHSRFLVGVIRYHNQQTK